MNEITETELADQVAAATLTVPGVAGLHSGPFGEVATYLVGRRVEGVRLRADEAEVHAAITFGTDIEGVAAAIRTAVEPLVAVPVRVTIEDVVEQGQKHRSP